MRNTKGQFIKGVISSPGTIFKKGQVPHNKGKISLGTKNCKQCKKDFTKRIVSKTLWGKVKFCSTKCSGLSRNGYMHTQETLIKLSKSHLGQVSVFKGKKRPEISGENNPRWIKDRTKIKVGDRNLHDPLTKQWRRQVKDRDNWLCRIADNNCNGRLEVHHILRWSKFPELRYEVNNGITLCHFHHPRKINDEMKLAPYFQSLVLIK